MKLALMLASLLLSFGSPVFASTPIANPAMEIVMRQIATYNAHDAESFASCYTPDAIIYDSSKGEQPVTRGRSEIIARYTKTFADNPRRSAEVRAMIIVGDFVTLHEYLPDINLHALVTYEVKNGLISRVWLH